MIPHLKSEMWGTRPFELRSGQAAQAIAPLAPVSFLLARPGTAFHGIEDRHRVFCCHDYRYGLCGIRFCHSRLGRSNLVAPI